MGDVYTYSYPKLILHHEVPFPSIGDAIYLTVYPAQMLGLLLLVRRRNPHAQPQHADRRGDPDPGPVAAVLGAADRALSARPHDGRAAQARLGRLSARATSSCSPRPSAWCSTAVDASRAFYLLSASIVSLLVTDFVYGILTLNNAFHHQLMLDLGWTAYQLLWATAALHPSMVTLEEPAKAQPRGQADTATPARCSQAPR